MSLLRDPISSTRESIKFRFKTTVANGVMLYSRGTQGDYLALQLKDNRMVLNIDLGSKIMTSLSVGSLLDDNVWHDVVISRNRREIIFSVDRVIVKGRLKAEFNRLNLNRAVSHSLLSSDWSKFVTKFLETVVHRWCSEYARGNGCPAKLLRLHRESISEQQQRHS